jgi:uncharacterized membrane protein (UPF0127 family)
MRARHGTAWIAALVWLTASAALAQPLAQEREIAVVTIAGERFELEVARDPATQFRGLGGRTHIARDGGMLFVFPYPHATAFVMRDCPIPIDVAFLDAEGRVISIHEMKPEPPRSEGESASAYESRLKQYPSGLPAWFAIETEGGRMRELGLRGGDRVEIDREAPRSERP